MAHRGNPTDLLSQTFRKSVVHHFSKTLDFAGAKRPQNQGFWKMASMVLVERNFEMAK